MDIEFLKYISSLVDYDPITGAMLWKERDCSVKDSVRWNSRYAGKEAGTLDDKGYRRILIKSFDGRPRRIRVHQVAWFILSGSAQSGEIDHINQDKLDNRAANLRDVSKSINQRNGTRKANNTSGVTGVTWHKQRGKWCAQASINGKHHHLGLFDDIEEAKSTVEGFRAKHDFTNRHGRAIVRAAAEIGRDMK